MIEGSDYPSFALEALAETLRGNLDGDITAKAQVARAIHLAHAAFPKQRKDFVGAKFFAGLQRHGV
jgi:hypothetical protein